VERAEPYEFGAEEGGKKKKKKERRQTRIEKNRKNQVLTATQEKRT